MKSHLLALLLLCATPALAQDGADKTGTIETLDAKNGFRTYKFGTPMADIPEMKKKGSDTYYVPKEPLTVGDARLMGLLFGATNGKLSSVAFGSFGERDCEKLLAALVAQYGPGQQVSTSKMSWPGNAVTMTYEVKLTYPTYVTRYSTSKPSKSCTVIIVSNAAMSEEQATKDAAAKKAAGDL